MTSRFLLPALLLAAGTACGDLVKNGGFDTGTPPKADGWALGPSYRLEESCGMNGARGIHWKREKAAPAEFGGQAVALKPGRIYDFSAWVKVKDLQGVAKDGVKACACLLLTVSDRNGKYLGEYYSKRVSDTKGDWMKIKGRTSRLPPSTGRVNLTPFVWHNATGEVWFDDIVVSEVESKPIAGLYTDVYRDLAWEGDVTFRAMLALDPEVPRESLKLELVFSDGALDNVRIPVTDFTSSDARVTVPVAKLPMGRLPVSLELRKASDGALLACESVMFERTAKRPDRKCWIDRANRLVVEGKPFFPLGCYVYTADAKMLDTYTKSAFNCLMMYPYCGRETYDRIAARGLKIIASAKDFMPNGRYAPRKYQTHDDADRAFISRIEAFKDHPGVIAWYLNDESPISDKDRLVRQYRYARERDPEHPAWALLYQHDQIRDYKPTCDIIGTDPYPIDSKPIGMTADYTRETVESFLGGPVWMVPQAFAWKWFIKDADENVYRMPTKEEMRAMGWQTVANGANGVIYYCFGTMLARMKPDEFAASWKGLCEVSDEMAKFVPVLLSEPAAAPTGFPKGVSGRCWKKDGKTFLLVVNETRESLSAELTPTTGPAMAKAVMGADECRVALKDGKLSVGLKPLACAILELK